MTYFFQSYDAGDDWYDEWDDDSENGSRPAVSAGANSFPHVPKSGSAGDVSSMGMSIVLTFYLFEVLE